MKFELSTSSIDERLIRAMDGLLRKSPAGRAVFVTSGAAIRPRAFWGAYAASKALFGGRAISCPSRQCGTLGYGSNPSRIKSPRISAVKFRLPNLT